jgi:hypothetical protein
LTGGRAVSFLQGGHLQGGGIMAKRVKAAARSEDPAGIYKPNNRLARCFKALGIPEYEIPGLVQFIAIPRHGSNADVLAHKGTGG